MRRKAMTALSLLCSAALSSGCAATRAPDIRLIPPTVPPALLRCAERPEPPTPEARQNGIRQRDVALFLLALAAAHGDCRAKLDAVAGLLAPPAP